MSRALTSMVISQTTLGASRTEFIVVIQVLGLEEKALSFFHL